MTIVKLGEGRYRVFVDVGRDASGRRRRHNEVVRGTKRDAERREREVRRSVDTGSYIEPNALTVAEYLKKWLDSVQAKVQERTYQGYEQKVRTHLIPDLGRIKLTDLRPLHVEEAEAMWLRSGNRRTGGPLDPQTLLHIHRCLHTAMDRAVKWRLIPVNPVDGVDAPHVPDEEKEFLTADQSEALVAALVDTEHELPILVGLYCGLRPTEYLALRWRDLDLDAGELRVMQNMHRVAADRETTHMGQTVRGFRFAQTKTHRSKRPVSITPLLVDVLRAWRPVQAAQRLQAGAAWTDLDLVPGRAGLPALARAGPHVLLRGARSGEGPEGAALRAAPHDGQPRPARDEGPQARRLAARARERAARPEDVRAPAAGRGPRGGRPARRGRQAAGEGVSGRMADAWHTIGTRGAGIWRGWMGIEPTWDGSAPPHGRF